MRKKGLFILKVRAMEHFSRFILAACKHRDADPDLVMTLCVEKMRMFVDQKLDEADILDGLIKITHGDDCLTLRDPRDERNVEHFGIKALGFLEAINKY